MIFFLFFQQISSAEKAWQELNSGISDTDIRSISVFPRDDSFICAASASSLYFSQDSGRLWQEVFSLQGQGDEINFVVFDSISPKIIYLATTKGLYATKNQGQDWQRIFRKVNEQARNVRWIALDLFNHQRIYLGTGEGLYFSQDSGTTWKRLKGGLPYSQVRSIAVHPANSQVLYLANTYGLFKSIDRGESWKRVYVTSHRIGDSDDEEDEEEWSELDEDQQNLINCVAIDDSDPKRIFMATGRGVSFSSDAGESWSKLPAEGLGSDYVNFVVTSSDKKSAVYAATKDGVFEFSRNSNRWREIYQGMTTVDVRSLALKGEEKQLFAGTDRGVFKTADLKNTQKQNGKEDFEQTLKELVQDEPTIREVQEVALRYGQVIHPDRIETLRRNAKLKALLPDISVDYDKTINYDSGSDRYYVGPHDWGFSFSWDVGDLVFSEQVRLIDSNARLAVQLRDDILDEVTRLYYERRKLQTGLMLDPPKSPKEKLDKTLRLQELTARIDGLTGGYFSRQSKGKEY